jgi:hypothetical protein
MCDMPPSRSIWFLAAGVTLVSARLPAQAAAVRSTPYSCADTTNRVLGFLVGEYTARAAFRGPTAWDLSSATVTVTRDLDGCVLREHFRGTRYGASYEYLALWSANGGASTPVQRFFVHSQHGILVLSGGRRSGDSLVVGDSVFLRGRWVYQEVALWREHADGTVLLSESRRSEDGRASWFATQRVRYVRRAGGAEQLRAP